MEALTPASPDGLPPFGDLIADDPFWRHPSGREPGAGVAHLRVWLTAGARPGYLAVVTETGSAASVTESAGYIWTELTCRYRPSLVLLEHGTYLCTNPITGVGIDNTDPPANCQVTPGVREIGWIDSGGGFSHVFTKPAYQDTLPAGSTPIGTMRGVPDVAFQASSRTGQLQATVAFFEPTQAPALARLRDKLAQVVAEQGDEARLAHA
jgi:hypothetical protein